MLAAALVAAVLAPQSPPQSPPPAPATRPERTAWEQTSTNADVAAFLADLARLPHGDRLRVGTIGATVQGRPLTIVRVARGAAGAPRLRALILANIHGGEVEGKEAVQVLLREVALGEHDDLLQHVDLAVVPVFNAD